MTHRNLRFCYVSNRRVQARIQQAAPVTATRAARAIAADLLGVSVGLLAAARRGSARGGALIVGPLVGISLPAYWRGVLRILVLGYHAASFP